MCYTMRYLLLASFVLYCGCLPRYQVERHGDEFQGVEIVRMDGNVLADPDRGGEWIELNAEVSKARRAAPAYLLRVVYRDAARDLRIPAGESLVLLVDGEPIPLRGTGSRGSRQTHVGRGIREEARYPVRADLLRRLAGAKAVRMRVVGSREYVERTFSAANLQNFKTFVAEHLDGAGPQAR